MPQKFLSILSLILLSFFHPEHLQPHPIRFNLVRLLFYPQTFYYFVTLLFLRNNRISLFGQIIIPLNYSYIGLSETKINPINLLPLLPLLFIHSPPSNSSFTNFTHFLSPSIHIHFSLPLSMRTETIASNCICWRNPTTSFSIHPSLSVFDSRSWNELRFRGAVSSHEKLSRRA